MGFCTLGITVYRTVQEMWWATTCLIDILLQSSDFLFLCSESPIKEPHSLRIQDKRLWESSQGAGEAGPLTSLNTEVHMSSWGKLESPIMIVCCSFGRWGRSLSEHSRVLRTLALLQFLRPGVALFPVACGLSNNPTSSLHRDHL